MTLPLSDIDIEEDCTNFGFEVMTNVTMIANKTYADEIIFKVQVYHEMANWRILNYIPFTVLVGMWLLGFFFVAFMETWYYLKEALEDYR